MTQRLSAIFACNREMLQLPSAISIVNGEVTQRFFAVSTRDEKGTKKSPDITTRKYCKTLKKLEPEYLKTNLVVETRPDPGWAIPGKNALSKVCCRQECTLNKTQRKQACK